MGGIPDITLNSGWKIPVLGFGTAAYPMPPPPELIESAVIDAIELGYRHFDTASFYQTEEPLGRAISEAISRGLIESRDELFITSKLWCTDADHDLVVPALRKTLKALGLEYLDLYLIHFPMRMKKGSEFRYDISEENLLPFDVRGTWEGMEECQRLGLTRSIGVSNFSIQQLSELLVHATIPPAVNQVEVHPHWQQKELKDFCKSNQIYLSAYSPLGGKGTSWGSNIIFDSKEIQQIAQSKGKTIAQLCLRWAFEHGVIFLPKSFNKGRMKENMEIFDWKLNEDELRVLNSLPQQKSEVGSKVVSKEEQHKSVPNEETS